MRTLSRPNLLQMAMGIATFAAVGPPIGGVVVALLNMIMTVADGYPLRSTTQATLSFLVVSWWFGVVPAAATGLAYAFASVRLRGFALSLITGSIGAVLSFAWFIHIFSSNIRFSLLLSISGFIAGLVVAVLLGIWPNNSFKPKPLRGSA